MWAKNAIVTHDVFFLSRKLEKKRPRNHPRKEQLNSRKWRENTLVTTFSLCNLNQPLFRTLYQLMRSSTSAANGFILRRAACTNASMYHRFPQYLPILEQPAKLSCTINNVAGLASRAMTDVVNASFQTKYKSLMPPPHRVDAAAPPTSGRCDLSS